MNLPIPHQFVEEMHKERLSQLEKINKRRGYAMKQAKRKRAFHVIYRLASLIRVAFAYCRAAVVRFLNISQQTETEREIAASCEQHVHEA